MKVGRPQSLDPPSPSLPVPSEKSNANSSPSAWHLRRHQSQRKVHHSMDCMDSLIVDPADAKLQFSLMLIDRLNDLEDKVREAKTQITSMGTKIASLENENNSLKAALAAQPRPQAYHIWVKVPRGTTREQVEDGLKREYADRQLTTDGVYRTGLCVSLEITYAAGDNGAYKETNACVFVFGARGIMPHQATEWVTAAVPGSNIQRASHVRMIWQDAEVEYFMDRLFGQDTWVTYPGRSDWLHDTMAPLCDEDDDCDVEGWMQQTYVHGLPAVPLDGMDAVSYT